MTWLGYVAAAAVVALLGAIAAEDARRARISPVLVGLLLLAGAAWLFAGGADAAPGPVWMHALGAAAGAGIPALLIAAAEAAGRRWPIYPGDAMLLGAVGAVLGARALAWAVALGCGLAVAHRICVQTRRGRPVTAGRLPAGPGLALGAALVFGALNAGIALADERRASAGGDPARIVATELPPVKNPLPEDIAAREIALDIPNPLPFSDLIARIGLAGEIEVVIEERPSRIEGGGAELSEPTPMLPGAETRLGPLLDDVAGRAGYGWEWEDGRVVFFRYRDREWLAARPGPEAVSTAVVEEPEETDNPFAGVVTWLGRLFGGGEAKETPAVDVAAAAAAGKVPDAATAAETATAAGEGEPGRADTASLPGEPETPGGAAEGKDAEPRAETEIARTVPSEVAEPEPPVWQVVPEEQKTVRGVLEAWADRAEWKVAWRVSGDFRIGAAARFEGEFLQAVDGLLSDPAVSRALVARAYRNRYLVIEGADR